MTQARTEIALLFWGWSCLAVRAEIQKPEPYLVCGEPVFNYGAVENTVEVRHTFIVSNASASAVSIQGVHSGCGCTQAAISRKEIPAGETAELAATLSLRGRIGPRQVNVLVMSNDPVRPVLPLMLNGTALPSPAVQPAAIPSPPQNPVLPIQGPAVLSPASLSRSTAAVPSLSPAPLGSARLAPGAGTAPATVVRAPSPEAPPQAPLVIVPSELAVPVSGPFPQVQYMILRTPHGQSFHVTGIACNLTGMRAELTRTELAWSQLRITVDRSVLDGNEKNGLLTLRTDLPAAPCVEVPVRFKD